MITQSRRRFLTTAGLACATSLVRAPHVLAAEGTLETTTVRLVNDTSICIAPEYMAEELLRAEGFTDIRYIEAPGIQQVDAFLRGELDFTNFVPFQGIQLIEAVHRLSFWPAFISAASNYSPGRIFAMSPTLRARRSGSGRPRSAC